MEGDGGSTAHGGSFPPPPLDITGKLALKKEGWKKKRAQTQMCCETFIAATAVSLRLTEDGQPTRLLLLLFSLSLSLRLVILAPFSFCFLSLSAWHFIGSHIRLRTLVTTGCLRVCDWMCVCCSGEWVVAWLFLSRLDRPAPEDQWGVCVCVCGGGGGGHVVYLPVHLSLSLSLPSLPSSLSPPPERLKGTRPWYGLLWLN